MCKGETVRLSCGEWAMEILPSFGMNAISLTFKEKEILRKPDDFKTLCENPYVYGLPLLFPANRTKGAAFEFMGKKYALPLNEPERNNHIHGLMYDAPFTVLETDKTGIKAAFENKDERYPFPFKMTIADTLTEKGFFRKLEITNLHDAPFPYTLAFHASFSEPDQMKAPVRERFVTDENYIPLGMRAPLTEKEMKYNQGISLKDYALSGFFASGGCQACLDDVRFSVSENFDEWILFNAGGGQGFVCIEPQAGEVNGLNTKDGCKIIGKGETHAYALSITREEIA